MAWSFPVGRLFGSEIRIHATFFLLLLWIGVSAFLDGGLPAAISNIVFILALFACVVAHEFGHALTARRFGIATPDITLLPIGGLARLDRMPEQPGREILVALAGPAVNVVIWAVLVIVLGAETDMEKLGAIEDPASGFLGRLAAVNIFLALFNLLPAFPMDGGRVFRAILSIWLDRMRATRIAAMGGQVLAFLFGFLGLTSGNPVLVLIAVFIFVAASAESSDVAMHSLARDVPARAAMITSFEALAPNDSLQAASDSLLRTSQAEFPVVEADGRLAGVLTRNAIFQALASERPAMPISEAMVTDIPAVILGAPLEKALSALNTTGAPVVAVTDPRGILLGYITRENIGEWLVIQGTKKRD